MSGCSGRAARCYSADPSRQRPSRSRCRSSRGSRISCSSSNGHTTAGTFSLYWNAPSQGAVAQLVRVPVCHTGGRGFEPRQPRLNPPRGTTHPAPPATAGGAFVFFGRALTSTYHVPVLADAVRGWATGACRVVDATVGGGGHTALFRELGAEVLAVDRDPEAIAAARARLGDTGIRYSSGPFGSAKVLGTIETFRPDRIFVDLGVSSHQLDTDARGFTFRPGALLDMRMAAGHGVTAADILNTWPEERLAGAFADLADEPRARRLARAVVRRRVTARPRDRRTRSEEHTSELQSPDHLVCRLLLEKKKNKNEQIYIQ